MYVELLKYTCHTQKKLFQYICHTQKSITLMIRDTAVLKIDLFLNQRKPNKDIQTFPNSKR